jgi:integrase/recombinase XerD
MNLEDILGSKSDELPPIPEAAPVITIFVRHSPSCKYAGDEFSKRCNCKKHFRWTQNGKQYRRKTGSRTWEEADRQKRRLEDQLSGRPVAAAQSTSLPDAIEIFKTDKKNQGFTDGVLDKYARELERLQTFAERHGAFTVAALSRELLIKYQGAWEELYPSSNTRQMVQARLKNFLRFCFDSRWLDRVPRLTTIKADEPPTLPLSAAEYDRLLEKAAPDCDQAAEDRHARFRANPARYSSRDSFGVERKPNVCFLDRQRQD